MRNNKLTVSLLGLVLSAGFAMAQDPGQSQNDSAPTAQNEPAPPPQQRPADPARQARRLGKQLGLSPGQVTQIEPVIAARQQQMESLRADTSLTPRQRRKQMRSIIRDSNSKMEAVMTDSQKQQYQQLLQARRQSRRQRTQQWAQQQASQEQAPPQPQEQ